MISINSVSKAYQISVYYKGITDGINSLNKDDRDLYYQIVAEYPLSVLENWMEIAKDNVSYQYDYNSYDYDNMVNEAKNGIAKDTGYDNDKNQQLAQEVQSAGHIGLGGVSLLGKIATKLGKCSAIVAAAATVAEEVAYLAGANNKKQVAVVNDLKDDVSTAAAKTTDAYTKLQSIALDINVRTEDASLFAEEKENEVLEAKAQYEFYEKIITKLTEKVNAGGTLDEGEIEMFKTAAAYLQTAGDLVESSVEEASTAIRDIYADINDIGNQYTDIKGNVMANSEALAKYAGELDETTSKNCVKVGLSCTAGSLGGFAAVGRLLALGPWGIAGAVVTGAAAGGLGVGAFEQNKMREEVNEEIEMRQSLDQMNNLTSAEYDKSLASFANDANVLRGMNINVPEGVENQDVANIEDIVQNNKKPGI